MVSLKEMQLKEVKGVRIGKCGALPHDPVSPVRAYMSVDELVRAFRGCAFGAGRLAIAADIYEEMLTEETTKFIGIAGALVPAGMRNVIAEMVREREVDVVVTTGANLVHDIIEALGDHHYKIDVEGSGLAASAETNDEMVSETETETETPTPIDDIWLREQGLERIYDVIVHEEAFARLEAFLRTVFDKLDCENHDGSYSISELTKTIGENLSDRDSILRAAVDSDVPVFCPAIADSMIGLHAWIYKQTSPLKVDAFSDMKELVDIFCDAKRTGAIILGGGVPKNFIFQTALIAPREQEGFDYAIQITTDTPENGGLSGATLEEAKSWGKVGAKAKAVTVYCDATIALPVIVAAVRERIAGIALSKNLERF